MAGTTMRLMADSAHACDRIVFGVQGVAIERPSFRALKPDGVRAILHYTIQTFMTTLLLPSHSKTGSRRDVKTSTPLCRGGVLHMEGSFHQKYANNGDSRLQIQFHFPMLSLLCPR
eukprot:scaffold5490_cov125-Cylindrotheca_fusiformis.AAC.13